METNNYCAIAGITIIILVGCLMHLIENDIFSITKIKKFRRLIVVLMCEVMLDLAFELIQGSEASRILLHAIKALELSINPILAFLVFDVFYESKKERADERMTKIRTTIISVAGVNLVLQFISLFGGIMFSIDESGIYQRGPLVTLYVILLVVAVVALVIGMLLYSKNRQGAMIYTLLSIAGILFLGIIARLVFPNENYDFLCLSLSIPFLLIYYSHVTLRVDPLTKLLTRQVYMRTIKKIDYTTIVIMIDANSFKLINDTFGHECGDQTLKEIAKAICEVYGKYGYCFRLGGDEFCVILKHDAFEKLVEKTRYHDVYFTAETLVKKLNEALQKRNEADKTGSYLKYGVAQGYAVFYSESDYPGVKNMMSFSEVLNLADKKMYHEKEIFKQNHPNINQEMENAVRTRVLYQPASATIINNYREEDQ